jgi:hypothetical protein
VLRVSTYTGGILMGVGLNPVWGSERYYVILLKSHV